MTKELDKKEDLIEDLEIKPEDEVKKKEEDFVSPGVSAPSPGVLDKIAGIFKKAKPETVPEIEPETEPEEESAVETKGLEKDEYEEIDPKFIEVAQAYGWDDQRIIKYAEEHSETDTLLLTNLMQDYVTKVKPKAGIEHPATTFGETIKDTETFLKLAEESPQVATLLEEILKPLAKRLDDVSQVSEEMRRDSETRKEADKIREDVRNFETANDIFDKSEIPSLGKIKNAPTYPDGSYVMNNPIFQERKKVWGVAHAFYAAGGTFQQAVKNALQWYKGQDVEKDVKDKIIKNLKKQEERIMPKRQEPSGVKTYTNDEERKKDLINTALSKYNIELP